MWRHLWFGAKRTAGEALAYPWETDQWPNDVHLFSLCLHLVAQVQAPLHVLLDLLAYRPWWPWEEGTHAHTGWRSLEGRVMDAVVGGRVILPNFSVTCPPMFTLPNEWTHPKAGQLLRLHFLDYVLGGNSFLAPREGPCKCTQLAVGPGSFLVNQGYVRIIHHWIIF